MPSDKLRLAVQVVNRTVLMYVVEQPERIKRGGGVFFKQDGVELCSASLPCLWDWRVLVRGNNANYDDHVTACRFDTHAEAIGFAARIKAAVRAYNAQHATPDEPVPGEWEIVE